MARKLVKKKKVTTKKAEVEFCEGDIVIIESLKFTELRHGTNTSMTKMVGKEYSVKSIDMHHSGKYPVVHMNNDTGGRWSFAPPDLILVRKFSDITSEAMPNEPIMFDPKELV